MRRILPHELALHEALPWTVYDEHGNLLLRQGYVIQQQRHLDSLFMRGAYVTPPAGEADPEAPAPPEPAPEPVRTPHTTEPVAARTRRLANSLQRLHTDVQRAATRTDMRMLVVGMSHVISQACDDDADGLLLALHTSRAPQYLVTQQLLGAAVVELLARDAGVDEVTRTDWVCAALTRDLGLLDMQAQLDQQTTPLAPEQRQLLQQHPGHSVRVLALMGVKESPWLQLVQQHHERCDGSGYPQQLQGAAITDGALLLAVADAYAAMVTPRANRQPHAPREAMRALYQARTTAYDSGWVEALLRCITQYPPGSAVVLANGEHALVRTRQREGQPLQVWAIQSSDGERLHPPQHRITAAPDCAIARAYAWPLAAPEPAEAPAEVCSPDAPPVAAAAEG